MGSKGVPFRTYIYVPEDHEITEESFLEREDEGHIFKVRALYLLICSLVSVSMLGHVHTI